MLALDLQLLAVVEAIEGRFDFAVVTASEGLRIARDTGQENCAAHDLAVLAWGAARRGDEAECRARTDDVFAVANEHGLGLQAAMARFALGELELGLGRPAESLAQLEALWAAGHGAGHYSFKLIAAPSIVEASVRVGQPERAQAAFDVFENWVANTASPYALPSLSRCRGLLSAGDSATRHFEEALRLHDDVDRPFERARTELVYGELLRRSRRRQEARRHLRAAVEICDALGASSWAERARTELRASGETARKRDPSTISQLTPQELQIARLVADGLSNRAIAAQLFLSTRTIDPTCAASSPSSRSAPASS